MGREFTCVLCRLKYLLVPSSTTCPNSACSCTSPLSISNAPAAVRLLLATLEENPASDRPVGELTMLEKPLGVLDGAPLTTEVTPFFSIIDTAESTDAKELACDRAGSADWDTSAPSSPVRAAASSVQVPKVKAVLVLDPAPPGLTFLEDLEESRACWEAARDARPEAGTRERVEGCGVKRRW